ncbi:MULTISPECIES: Hsp20/alpha crystallin family protein [unclassified Leucobacter]|uniref:Hsp20/alpha crystallin family protein n=1 Tax=unclassified Leucobacter TaxID=2621730 RepID=UPI00165D8A88|nr:MULTISPECIES: Hsp20/alpha crystallin family protein [unclassified Leucobacter]MBC9953259.1 Hsp20/alpha crystallin family protein [Leucobacter sp. cx-42]
MSMSFDPFAEMERIANGMLQRSSTRVMPVDLYRDSNRYVLNADLPGMDPGSIDVDVDGQVLTIRANRTTANVDGVKWLSQERPSGGYVRQFSIGEGVDSSAISASYDNGVLSLIIPMSEKAKPRKIEVQSNAKADAGRKELVS